MATHAGQQTGPMRSEFPAARMGHRGLDPAVVYKFVDDTRGELRRLTTENEQLQGRFATQGAHVLRSAQHTAEELIDDARAEAEQMAQDARRAYAEALGGAREKAERVTGEALEQSERIVAAAQAEAESIMRSTTEGARSQVAYYLSVASAERDGLLAQLDALAARVRAWRDQAGGQPGPMPQGRRAAG